MTMDKNSKKMSQTSLHKSKKLELGEGQCNISNTSSVHSKSRPKSKNKEI